MKRFLSVLAVFAIALFAITPAQAGGCYQSHSYSVGYNAVNVVALTSYVPVALPVQYAVQYQAVQVAPVQVPVAVPVALPQPVAAPLPVAVAQPVLASYPVATVASYPVTAAFFRAAYSPVQVAVAAPVYVERAIRHVAQVPAKVIVEKQIERGHGVVGRTADFLFGGRQVTKTTIINR